MDLGPYKSELVGKYLYARAFDNGQALNATQLQKLLYITYGLLLAGYSRRACTESPQAWPYGPVFPRSQKRFEEIQNARLGNPELAEISQDSELTEVIDASIDTFSGFSAKHLSDWSHEIGSPWYVTKEQPGFRWGAQISDEAILDYFKRFAS